MKFSLEPFSHWPGNIRELRNVIERAVISSPGSRLRLDLALPPTDAIPPVAEITPDDDGTGVLTENEMRALERSNLVAALRRAEGRVWGPRGAAALLGIKPSTLTYRMNRFGIEKPAKDG